MARNNQEAGMKYKLIFILIAFVYLLIGCEKSPPPMPEVNDANCTDEVIGKITDNLVRRYVMQFKFFLLLIAAVLSTACEKSPPPMPEVNDANCQVEKIKQIPDKETREKMAHACSTRVQWPTTPPPNPIRWSIDGPQRNK
ncbi:MAG: entry exclusion lipoprotein TrbK [Candidatus Accumulibacter sp.]|jgi:entry exclusion lipoprotein TrbK|nr:entry exclusion lipoprotein TrbK [Accumulibacter sp.]